MKKKLARKRKPIYSIEFIGDTKKLLVPIADVKLWEDNPRYNDAAVPKLAKLFQLHGVRSPVVADRKTGIIYKGNTTFKALQALGCTEIPVLYQDFPSESAAKAYGISDNKAGEYSEWDADILFELLKAEEIEKLPTTGFKETELNRMIKKQEDEIIRDVDNYGLLKCIVLFHPDIKEDLKHYIEKTVMRKFGKKVIVKF